MFTRIKKLLALVAISAVSGSSAFAFTITPNSTATLGTSGFYFVLQGTSGALNGKTYAINFNNASGTGQFGSLSNGVLDTVTFNSLLNSATIALRTANGDTPVSGSLTGNMTLSYNNVSLNQAANQAAAIGGISSNKNSSVTFNGTIDGNAVNFTANVMPAYMDFTKGMFNGIYDAPINAFSNSNKLNFAAEIDGSASAIHAWIKGTSFATINGVGSNGFSFSADLHNTLSGGSTAVPEPATVGLMISGLVGVASRRRRKRA